MAGTYAADTSILAGPGGQQGLDGTGAYIYDLDCLVEDGLKRQITDSGATWWDPAATINLRDLALARLTDQQVVNIRRRVQAIFAQDPRAVYTVTLTYDKAAESLTSSVKIQPMGSPQVFTAVYTFNSNGTYGVSAVQPS